MFWKRKVLLAKTEVTYGVDPTPTGAANAILAMNVNLEPMAGEDVSRNLERPYYGAQDMLPVGLHSVLTFDVEIVGSGTLGTAPAWGPLHRACSCAEVVTAGVSVEYTPITANPEAMTLWMNIDGILYKLSGARGTWVAKFNSQGIPVYSYSFTGLFAQPAMAALPVPTYTAFRVPQASTKANTPTFTVGGTTLRLRSFEFDRGTKVEKRFLMNFESIEIVDAVESLKAQIETVSLATYNPYTAPTGALVPIQLIHGTVAATRVKMDFGQARQRRPGLTSQQDVVESTLAFDPLPLVGDDQWKITLS